MAGGDPDEQARRLAADSLASGYPTGWFERLYAAAEHGQACVPWDRGAPHRLLVQWADQEQRGLDGHGSKALVVGCGLGEDAEFIATLGFATVAFDIAASAIRAARWRFPDSSVHYLIADLLNPPGSWRAAFDLVVESFTVQALPEVFHQPATSNVSSMVAPGGTLIVIAAARDEEGGSVQGPPWPLTRTEIDAFATDDLQPVEIEHLADAGNPGEHRWRAEFRRPLEPAT